jgi:hypothetical protein
MIVVLTYVRPSRIAWGRPYDWFKKTNGRLVLVRRG